MDVLVAPVYRVLLFPPMVIGIPRKLFMLIMITSLAIIVGAGSLWFIAVTVASLIGARALGSIDRYAFEIFTEFNRLPAVAD